MSARAGTVSGRIAAIGEPALLDGYRLAGVSVVAADTDEAFRRAWTALPGGTAIVILTARAARSLGPVLADPLGPMTVVLPA